MLRRVAELGLSGAVQLRGDCEPGAELRALCRGAAILAMPTVLETFGFLPVLRRWLPAHRWCAPILQSRANFAATRPLLSRRRPARGLAEARLRKKL